MSVTVQSLWGDGLQVRVLTPLVILKAQAAELSRLTRRILEGQVRSTTAGSQVRHRFEVFAPVIGYQHELFEVYHDTRLVYPVWIESEVFEARTFEAATEAEFVEALERVLTSPRVRSVLDSLIAQSNEIRPLEDDAA